MQTLLKWEFYYNKSIGYTLKRRVQYAKVPLKSSHFNHLRCYFVVALDLQMHSDFFLAQRHWSQLWQL